MGEGVTTKNKKGILDSMLIIKLKREILLKYRLMKNAESSTFKVHVEAIIEK